MLVGKSSTSLSSKNGNGFMCYALFGMRRCVYVWNRVAVCDVVLSCVALRCVVLKCLAVMWDVVFFTTHAVGVIV